MKADTQRELGSLNARSGVDPLCILVGLLTAAARQRKSFASLTALLLLHHHQHHLKSNVNSWLTVECWSHARRWR
jgi:hypothetical protein